MTRKFKFLLVMFLVLGLSFGVLAKTTKAVTFDELVAQVASLKKEIVSLKKALTGSVASSLDVANVTLKLGSNGPDVYDIQLALKTLGYYNGKLDSSYGPLTAAAVSKYQAAHGLEVTGVVDQKTKNSLFGTDSNIANKGGGDGSDKATLKLTCLTRSANVIMTYPHPQTRSLRFILGTDGANGYLYVKPGEHPALFPFDALSDDVNNGIFPKAPYTVGSGSTKLVFQATLLESDYPAGSFNLSENPDTAVFGDLYQLSLDGTWYKPLILGSLKNLPPCDTKPALQAPVTPVPPTCVGCGTLGENGGGEGKYFGHWKRAANPVTIGVSYLADQGLYGNAAYDFAFTDWNASPVLNLIPGNQVKIINGYYDQPFLSSTSVVTSNSDQHPHIISAEIRLNDKYIAIGSGTQYDTPDWRQYALCDAMGHAFGLSHQDVDFLNFNKGTCMDYTKDPSGQLNGGLSNLHPNINDFIALATAHHENPGDVYGNKPEGNQSNQTNIYYTALPQ